MLKADAILNLVGERISAKELAAILGVSRMTIYLYCQRGLLPAEKRDKVWHISLPRLREMAMRNELPSLRPGPRQRITPAQRREVVRLREAGHTTYEIAERTGISPRHVSEILWQESVRYAGE